MTLIDMLPLIRGWRWKKYSVTRTVLLNQELLVYQPPPPGKEIGWVVGIALASNDAYIGLRLLFPGYDSGYAFPGIGGPTQVNPAGTYLEWYMRPNPLRTIGQYFMFAILPAYAYPFHASVRAYLSLRTGSTEPFATGLVGVTMIVVEDRNLFLKDFRKVLYGRWAPLMDLIGHVPLLRRFVAGFEQFGIPYKEEEKIVPPGIAR